MSVQASAGGYRNEQSLGRPTIRIGTGPGARRWRHQIREAVHVSRQSSTTALLACKPRDDHEMRAHRPLIGGSAAVDLAPASRAATPYPPCARCGPLRPYRRFQGRDHSV